MSVRSVTYYQCVCDWPGCDACAQESSDYTAWGAPGDAVDDAENAGWWTGLTETLHYCQEHPAVWASDLADGLETAPEPPYLLIHDGDTDNPSDNGYVSLVEQERALDPDTPGERTRGQ